MALSLCNNSCLSLICLLSPSFLFPDPQGIPPALYNQPSGYPSSSPTEHRSHSPTHQSNHGYDDAYDHARTHAAQELENLHHKLQLMAKKELQRQKDLSSSRDRGQLGDPPLSRCLYIPLSF